MFVPITTLQKKISVGRTGCSTSTGASEANVTGRHATRRRGRSFTAARSQSHSRDRDDDLQRANLQTWRNWRTASKVMVTLLAGVIAGR